MAAFRMPRLRPMRTGEGRSVTRQTAGRARCRLDGPHERPSHAPQRGHEVRAVTLLDESHARDSRACCKLCAFSRVGFSDDQSIALIVRDAGGVILSEKPPSPDHQYRGTHAPLPVVNVIVRSRRRHLFATQSPTPLGTKVSLWRPDE